jgi:hypothetical protein
MIPSFIHGLSVFVVWSHTLGVEAVFTERDEAVKKRDEISRFLAYRDTPLFVDRAWLDDGEDHKPSEQ